MKKSDINYLLYLVTDRDILAGRDLGVCVEEAILGGVTLVQLREKELSSRDFYQAAQLIKRITDKYRVPFIINDRLDIALAVDADGLHIGQEDLPLTVARTILGNDKLIGVSAGNLVEAQTAEKDGADYLGVGAVFTTPTKKDADHVSLAELARIKAGISIPVVAIGGIGEQNAKSVMEARVDGISVVSAILGKPDVRQAAADLLMVINEK